MLGYVLFAFQLIGALGGFIYLVRVLVATTRAVRREVRVRESQRVYLHGPR